MPGWFTFAQQASIPTFAIAALLIAVTQIIKVLPQLRQAQLSSDSSLRTDLLARIDALETEVKALRKALYYEQRTHAAEVLDMQHDLANESSSLDALILLAEDSPERVVHQIPKIKEMRERHRERMAIKRGAREAALIAQGANEPLVDGGDARI